MRLQGSSEARTQLLGLSLVRPLLGRKTSSDLWRRHMRFPRILLERIAITILLVGRSY